MSRRRIPSTRADTELPAPRGSSPRRMNADVHRARAPGDLLLRPLAVVALMTLILNDHVLKRLSPGLLTGKVSDIAGLVFLPLLIISIYELARAAARRPWRIGDRGVAAVAATVAIGFAATKFSTAVGSTYGDMLGWLRWPLMGHWSHIAISADPTDVLCTPGVIIAWIEARAYVRCKA